MHNIFAHFKKHFKELLKNKENPKILRVFKIKL